MSDDEAKLLFQRVLDLGPFATYIIFAEVFGDYRGVSRARRQDGKKDKEQHRFFTIVEDAVARREKARAGK